MRGTRIVSKQGPDARPDHADSAVESGGAETKTRSTSSVLRDGLSGEDLHLNDSELLEFEDFKQSLLQELQPRGAIQMVLFNTMLHAAMGLKRTSRMEAHYMALGPAALEDDDTRQALDLLAKYQVRYERSYYRARKELEKMQAAARVTKPRSSNRSRPLLVQ